MFSLLLHCEPGQEDLLVADLAEVGTAGIIEEENGLRAFFEDSAGVLEVASALSVYAPARRLEAKIDWEQVTRDAWPPLLVGTRFFLVPPWRDDPAPGGRLRLEVNPGMACGTGWHPCTQLCLEALEQHVQPGDRVLDTGSGSGILCTAAILLGAQPIGCDIDFEAVAVARERVSCPAITGSLDAIRSRSMDVIVANISSAAIEGLAHEFSRVRKAKSTLILSGFPEWDRIEGFQVRSWMRKGEWLCGIC
ncbi:MAG: 50S ribosomal protein L11 methyltransferase [Bryobacteraceae bacterium]